MKKSEDVFRLIKSLTKSEKRYFKIHASRHSIGGRNIYVKLFDAIDSMKEYDEDLVKLKFKGEKFVSSLFSTKNYLFNIILKSLTEYYATGSLRQEINRIIDEFLILMEKGMYKQAEKRLIKAKALTIKNEMFELVLDILNLELRLLTRLNYTGKAHDLYTKNAKEKSQISGKLNNFNEIINTYYLLSVIWQKDKSPDSGDREWIEKNITKNPLFKNDQNALSNKAKLFYYRILFIASETNLDTQKSYSVLKKIIEHTDSHDEVLNNFAGQYINSLTNLVSLDISLKKYNSAEKNIEKLKNLPGRLSPGKLTITTEASIFHYTYFLLFVLCIETVQLDRGLILISEVESKLKQYKGYILKFRIMQFYFFFANMHFLRSEYDSSLKWLNKILNENTNEVSPDLMSYSRILSLVIHYEKNDYELIEHMIKSTKRFLSKNQRTFKFEKSVLDFLSKALRLSDDKNINELLLSFKKSLLAILNDPYESDAIENLDLISWIESRLQNKPIAAILKEKNTRK
jgi:hypothetical protein